MDIKKDVFELNSSEKFVGFMSPEDEEKVWINTFKREAKEEGIQEGIQEEKNETAKKMLLSKYNPKEISKITGLSLEEIEKLK